MKNINEEPKPYVVSGDLKLLLNRWAKRRSIKLPTDEEIDGIRSGFQNKMGKIFPSFEFVPEEEMLQVNELASQARKEGLTAVSLDEVYCQTDYRIGLTRGVDRNRNEVGLVARKGSLPKEDQFDALKAAGLKRVALIDDVVYSGGVISEVRESLVQRGIEVPLVCAGIAVKEGIDALESSGCEISSVRAYRKGVLDEVCERDFFPGVDFGGRTVVENGRTESVGIPYILPWGKPEKWASIPPEDAVEISDYCIGAMTKLFVQTAVLNWKQAQVVQADLDRYLPDGYGWNKPVTDILDDAYDSLRRLKYPSLFGRMK